MICPHVVVAYTVGGSRSTTTGIINLPQQWKQIWFCREAGDTWRQTPARTPLRRIRHLNLSSLNYMTSCAMVFFRFFMITYMTFFLENNNKWYKDILHGHGTPWPAYKSKFRQMQEDVICWRETVRSGTTFYNDLSNKSFIVRLCSDLLNKLTQICLTQNCGLIICMRINSKMTWNINLAWTYNAASGKLQLNLMIIELHLSV